MGWISEHNGNTNNKFEIYFLPGFKLKIKKTMSQKDEFQQILCPPSNNYVLPFYLRNAKKGFLPLKQFLPDPNEPLPSEKSTKTMSIVVANLANKHKYIISLPEYSTGHELIKELHHVSRIPENQLYLLEKNQKNLIGNHQIITEEMSPITFILRLPGGIFSGYVGTTSVFPKPYGRCSTKPLIKIQLETKDILDIIEIIKQSGNAMYSMMAFNFQNYFNAYNIVNFLKIQLFLLPKSVGYKSSNGYHPIQSFHFMTLRKCLLTNELIKTVGSYLEKPTLTSQHGFEFETQEKNKVPIKIKVNPPRCCVCAEPIENLLPNRRYRIQIIPEPLQLKSLVSPSDGEYREHTKVLDQFCLSYPFKTYSIEEEGSGKESNSDPLESKMFKFKIPYMRF